MRTVILIIFLSPLCFGIWVSNDALINVSNVIDSFVYIKVAHITTKRLRVGYMLKIDPIYLILTSNMVGYAKKRDLLNTKTDPINKYI